MARIKKAAKPAEAEPVAAPSTSNASVDYQIVLEHCNSWSVYKRNAKTIEQVKHASFYHNLPLLLGDNNCLSADQIRVQLEPFKASFKEFRNHFNQKWQR